MPPWIHATTAMISVAFYLLTWAIIPHVLLQRKQPLATLSWIWAILLFPFIGPLMYLLIGTERVRRRTRAGRRAIKGNAPLSIIDEVPLPTADSEDESNLFRAMARINGRSATRGNSTELLADGASFYPALERAIEAATHHVHLEFYIWREDHTGIRFRDALVAAANRGVEVRVLLDEIGSIRTSRRFFEPLVSAGGKFSWFSTFAPLRGAFHLNLRNHRKLVVIDGAVAFAGGINVGDEYLISFAGGPPHRDAQVRIEGPAVCQLAMLFAEDWIFSFGEALTGPEYYPPAEPKGDSVAQIVSGGPDNEIVEIQLSLLALLNETQKRAWVTTPYFVPEPTLLCALQLAALRGCDVRLIVPERSNYKYLGPVTRSFYADLLPFGVRVFEYKGGLMHAKLGVYDDDWCSVGSANLDVRSLHLNFEMNLLLESRGVAREIEADLREFMDSSTEVSLEAFRSRPLRQRLLEAIFRPLSPLL